jgi:transposase
VAPEQTKLALSPQALALLTDGVDLRGAKLRPWYERAG